jgi:hypothetical protein
MCKTTTAVRAKSSPPAVSLESYPGLDQPTGWPMSKKSRWLLLVRPELTSADSIVGECESNSQRRAASMWRHLWDSTVRRVRTGRWGRRNAPATWDGSLPPVISSIAGPSLLAVRTERGHDA